MLTELGFTNLVNVHGGMTGAHDAAGAVTEPGWAACGYATSTQANPERTWDAVREA